MKHLGQRPAARGFTILEVVLAMAVLLFGMVGILGLLTMGASLTRTAQMRTEAASATEAVVADLEETLFPPVQAPNSSGAEEENELGPPREIKAKPLSFASGPGQIVYSARAVQNPRLPSEYRVDIEISWTSAGVQRERTFSTILVRELPFGERLRRQFVEARPAAAPVIPRADASGEGAPK